MSRRSAPAPVLFAPPRAPSGHGHLWAAADGTGLHAPFGELVHDASGDAVCCHLCGHWFRLLGAHVRVHGHTADSYRELTGLCASRALAGGTLSDTLSRRQRQAYQQPEVQARLAVGQQLARTGQLGWRQRAAERTRPAEPLERVRLRETSLAAGRAAQQVRREQRLARRLHGVGSDDLHAYLRQAYRAGADLEQLGRDTGLGRARLRAALLDAGVQVRAQGANTAAGRRSRARAADARAGELLGVTDLPGWLRARRADGWTLTRLAEAVGHSPAWVRWRLDDG